EELVPLAQLPESRFDQPGRSPPRRTYGLTVFQLTEDRQASRFLGACQAYLGIVGSFGADPTSGLEERPPSRRRSPEGQGERVRSAGDRDGHESVILAD